MHLKFFHFSVWLLSFFGNRKMWRCVHKLGCPSYMYLPTIVISFWDSSFFLNFGIRQLCLSNLTTAFGSCALPPMKNHGHAQQRKNHNKTRIALTIHIQCLTLTLTLTLTYRTTFEIWFLPLRYTCANSSKFEPSVRMRNLRGSAQEVKSVLPTPISAVAWGVGHFLNGSFTPRITHCSQGFDATYLEGRGVTDRRAHRPASGCSTYTKRSQSTTCIQSAA